MSNIQVKVGQKWKHPTISKIYTIIKVDYEKRIAYDDWDNKTTNIFCYLDGNGFSSLEHLVWELIEDVGLINQE